MSSDTTDGPVAGTPGAPGAQTGDWHPGARRLLEYWRSKQRDGRLPGRTDIDPVEIAKLLPFVYLCDVVRGDGAPRVRFRLVGTGIVERFGRDLGGQWMDEAYDESYFEQTWPQYKAMIETATPQYEHLNARYAYMEHLTYARLICPLAGDGSTVDGIAGFLGFDVA